jgi:hypothetical protein
MSKTACVSVELSPLVVAILNKSGLSFDGRPPTNNEIIGRVEYFFTSNENGQSQGMITGVRSSRSGKDNVFALLPNGSIGDRAIYSFEPCGGKSSKWCAVLFPLFAGEEFPQIVGTLKLGFASLEKKIIPTRKVGVTPQPLRHIFIPGS